jgi:hypothetical protein
MSGKIIMPGKRTAQRDRRLRLLLALLLVLGATVSVSVAAQRSALAAKVNCAPQEDGDGEWHVLVGCASIRIPAAHNCAIIGSSFNNETLGIECADLYVTNTDSAQQIWGEGEFYCQGPNPKCLGMNVTVWISARGNGFVAATAKGSYVCNTRPSCPDGGEAKVATSHLDVGENCVLTHSFEPVDGARITTGPFTTYTNHEVISIEGATAASHAYLVNNSQNLNICLG